MTAASNQAAALGQQAQALVSLAAQQCPAGSPVLVQFQPRQQDLTPARVIGHRVEVEAGADAAAVRVFAHIEFQSRKGRGTQTRHVDISRVQLQQPDGSDHTTS